jgi:arginase
VDVDVIGVPYHLDEYLPDLDLPLAPAAVVTVDLPPGDPWERLAFLYSRVARAVAGGPAVVESGDCTTALGTVAACTWHPGHAAARHVAPDLAAALAGAGGE